MMAGSRPEALADVVKSQLCCGCGACAAACERGAVRLVNDEAEGISPEFVGGGCGECRECLAFCPGAVLQYRTLRRENPGKYHPLIGPYLEIYDGYASDEAIRRQGSSGGILSALALYCLEAGQADAVLQTGMDPAKPWLNKSVISRTRDEVVENSGSRYAPSSPCETLRELEESGAPCIFIGKPCDVAAVYAMRRVKRQMDMRLALLLSFFCAGPPASRATRDFIAGAGIDPQTVTSIRYRGNGWPGEFEVRYDGNRARKSFTYRQSWGALARFRRPFRCSICPDGMGEFADIACGDAWHQYKDNGDPGRSTVIVRTFRGRVILEKACEAGYVTLEPSTVENILSGQGLQKRKHELYGRLLAMRLTALPRPDYEDFPGEMLWHDTPPWTKVRVIAGTVRRIALRHYLKKSRT